MQIAFHIGAHCTDEGRLLRTLLARRAALSAEGVAVPGPGRYRPLLREATNQLRGRTAPPDMQAALFDALIEGPAPRHVLLDHDAFLAAPANALGEHRIYPRAGEKVRRLAQLFPRQRLAFFLALRNPAVFLPELSRLAGEPDLATFLAGADPMRLRWSDTVARIRRALPDDADLTVWCHEDSPVLWFDLLGLLGNTDPETLMPAALDFPASLLTEAARPLLAASLQAQAPCPPDRRRRIIAAYLAAHARPEALEAEIAMAGWSQGLVDALGAAYEADLAAIAALDGVTLLVP